MTQIESVENSLPEEEVLNVLKRYSRLDPYELVGMTGIPLSVIEKTLVALIAEEKVVQVLNSYKGEAEGHLHLRYELTRQYRGWRLSDLWTRGPLDIHQ